MMMDDVTHGDGEAGGPVVEESDVSPQTPAWAAVCRAFRLAELRVAGDRLEVESLQGAHRDNGLVAEERGPVC